MRVIDEKSIPASQANYLEMIREFCKGRGLPLPSSDIVKNLEIIAALREWDGNYRSECVATLEAANAILAGDSHL